MSQMLESLENNEVILLDVPGGRIAAGGLRGRSSSCSQPMPDCGGSLNCCSLWIRSSRRALPAWIRRKPLSNEPAMTRRIGRAMRQHMADRAAAADRTVKPPQGRLAIPWWSYPAAVAALVFLAFLTWVATFNSVNPVVPVAVVPQGGSAVAGPVVPSTTASDGDGKSARSAQEIESSFGPSTEKDDNQMVALRADPQVALGGDQNE